MKALLVFLFVVLSGFVMRTRCSYDFGGCDVHAHYHSASNNTYWTAACDDGSVYNGAIGGNEIPAICGI